MNSCKSLDCPCHLKWLMSSYQPPTTISMNPCCPDCHTTLPPKVTANNLWKIVASIKQIEDPHIAAVRFYLRFRAPLGGSPLDEQKFGVAVSQEMLAKGGVSVRAILAQQLNEYFAKPGNVWPEHLAEYLTVPDNQFPPTWQDIAWESPTTTVAYMEQSYSANSVGGQTVTSDLERHIPGLLAYVACPHCPLPHEMRIVQLVQHLNDSCGYSREQIADWLESLDVDLSFPAEPPPPKQLPFAKREEKLVILGHTLQAAEQEARRRRRRPHEVELTSSYQGHRRLFERLQGRRGYQYVILPGTYVHEEVAALLQYSEAVEVGEEEPTPADKTVASAAKLVALAYQTQFEHQQKMWDDLQTFAAQPKQVGKSYHLQIWDEAQHVEPVPQLHHEFKGDPKALALQKKMQDAEHHATFAVNPTKKNPFKK